MGELQTFPEEMTKLATSLDDAAVELDSMGRAPVANAGESIALVAEAVGRLSQASVGVSDGLHRGADDLRTSRDEYVRNDGAAADGMPTPPSQ